MDDKYLILSIAKIEIEKKLEKAEKKAQATSAKLQQHEPFKGTKNKGVRLWDITRIQRIAKGVYISQQIMNIIRQS